MKKILFLFAISSFILFSCSKGKEEVVEVDATNAYVQFVSATNKVPIPGGAEVRLNFSVTNSSQVSELHIYSGSGTYQYYITAGNGSQYVVDRFIQPSTTSREYYFVVILNTLEKITSKPFIVKF